jgi:hypothetical protein
MGAQAPKPITALASYYVARIPRGSLSARHKVWEQYNWIELGTTILFNKINKISA